MVDDRTIPDIHAHLEAERAAAEAAAEVATDEAVEALEERRRRAQQAARLGSFVIGFSVILLGLALPWFVHTVTWLGRVYMAYWRWVQL
jgi:hypothetical protein